MAHRPEPHVSTSALTPDCPTCSPPKPRGAAAPDPTSRQRSSPGTSETPTRRRPRIRRRPARPSPEGQRTRTSPCRPDYGTHSGPRAAPKGAPRRQRSRDSSGTFSATKPRRQRPPARPTPPALAGTTNEGERPGPLHGQTTNGLSENARAGRSALHNNEAERPTPSPAHPTQHLAGNVPSRYDHEGAQHQQPRTRPGQHDNSRRDQAKLGTRNRWTRSQRSHQRKHSQQRRARERHVPHSP